MSESITEQHTIQKKHHLRVTVTPIFSKDNVGVQSKKVAMDNLL